MNDRDRLHQIRALRERLERLPASPQRDRILRDVRSRAVDIESGMPAAPMRPAVEEDEALLAEPPRATPAGPVRRRPERRPTPASTQRARARTDSARSRTSVAGAAAAASIPEATPLRDGVRLCLDEDAVIAPEPGGGRPTAPWTRGLRG
jgi:hypothetical protein